MKVTEKPAIELSGADLGREATVDVLGTTFAGTLNSVSHYPLLGTCIGLAVRLPDGDRRQLDANLEAGTMVRLTGETSPT